MTGDRYILWYLQNLKGKTCKTGLERWFDTFGQRNKTETLL